VKEIAETYVQTTYLNEDILFQNARVNVDYAMLSYEATKTVAGLVLPETDVAWHRKNLDTI